MTSELWSIISNALGISSQVAHWRFF